MISRWLELVSLCSVRGGCIETEPSLLDQAHILGIALRIHRESQNAVGDQRVLFSQLFSCGIGELCFRANQGAGGAISARDFCDFIVSIACLILGEQGGGSTDVS